MPCPRPVQLALRLVLILASLLAASAAWADQPFVRPDKPGPFAVGRVEMKLAEEARDDRTLVFDVLYPVDKKDAKDAPASLYTLSTFSFESPTAVAGAAVSEDGPFPLVIFSHGSGSVRFQSFFLTEMLASHGFVVVSGDHAGDTVLPDLLGQQPEFLASAANRVEDVSLLIDAMLEKDETPGDRFHDKLRRKRIGVAGHSFGGFTSLASVAGFSGATASEPPDDFEPIEGDSRVRAIVPIAPVSSFLSDAELASIRVPTLVLGGTLDTRTPVEAQSAPAFDGLGSAVVRVDLNNAVHGSFTNICRLVQALINEEEPVDSPECFGDDVLAVDQAHRLTTLYTVAHFQRFLNKDRRYGAFLTRRYAKRFEPDVIFDRRPNGVQFFGGSLEKLLRLVER